MRIALMMIVALMVQTVCAAEKPKYVESFCGYKFGGEPPKQTKILFSKPPTSTLGWVVEQKLKKPFRSCRNVALTYDKDDKKLCAITIKSDIDFKMTDQEAEQEVNNIVEILKAKYKDLNIAFTSTKCYACASLVAGQWFEVSAKKGMYVDKHRLNRSGEKSPAYVISVTVKTSSDLYDKPKPPAPSALGPGSGIDVL